jgi:hypothetical protein
MLTTTRAPGHADAEMVNDLPVQLLVVGTHVRAAGEPRNQRVRHLVQQVIGHDGPATIQPASP